MGVRGEGEGWEGRTSEGWEGEIKVRGRKVDSFMTRGGCSEGKRLIRILQRGDAMALLPAHTVLVHMTRNYGDLLANIVAGVAR